MEIASGVDVCIAMGGSRPADVARLAATWLEIAPEPLRGATVHPLRSHLDIGVPLAVDAPDRVGWDRLLAARAALSVRSSSARPTSKNFVVVSVGTATTVDLVTGGVFQGGAILPGIDLGGRALHEHTQALPLVQPGRSPRHAAAHFPNVNGHEIPVTGRNTVDAITSGLVWGHVGAITELVRRQTAPLVDDFEIWLTGGAAALVAEHLSSTRGPIRCAPHLALSGLALTGAARSWQ